MRTCSECIWFDSDEYGNMFCTIDPPNYKGEYPAVSPDTKACLSWVTEEVDLEGYKADGEKE